MHRADRVIRLGDLAAAVATLGLELPVLVRDLPKGAALWDACVRQRPPPRFAWLLARWRRARRRRAGWAPQRLHLRWTPRRIDAVADGRRIASIRLDEGIEP